MRILQLADLHLDAPLSDLQPERRRARREDLRAVLHQATEVARSRPVDVFLVAGDLLEAHLTTSETMAALATCFENLSPIPVVIAPGNQDAFSPDSPYAIGTEGFPGRRSAGAWPPNVLVFREPRFETREFEGFTVTGIAQTAAQSVEGAFLAGLDAPDDDRVHLLLFHGTRAGFPQPPGQALVSPFTTAELVACGFDYAALGHLHEHRLIKDGMGRILGGYSGAPAVLREIGGSRGGVILGDVVRGEGLKPESIELIDLDPRPHRRIEVTLTGVSTKDVVREKVREGVRRECAPGEMAVVVLKGRVDPALVLDGRNELGFLAEDGSVFHATLLDETEPGYDLEEIRQDRESTRGAFVDSVLEEIASRSKPEETQPLRDALVYGMDAFSGLEVRRRNRGDS